LNHIKFELVINILFKYTNSNGTTLPVLFLFPFIPIITPLRITEDIVPAALRVNRETLKRVR